MRHKDIGTYDSIVLYWDYLQEGDTIQAIHAKSIIVEEGKEYRL